MAAHGTGPLPRRHPADDHRRRRWLQRLPQPDVKAELARLAADIGLAITVCHMPPGTSKWNKIEHRLFSFISMNWRGRPLTTYRAVVELIAATTTRTGLNVQADLDQGHYPIGVKVSDKELAAIDLHPNAWHGDWNYSLGGMPLM